jgi:hypothetical protein
MDPTVRTIGRGLLSAFPVGLRSERLEMLGLTGHPWGPFRNLDLTGVPLGAPVTFSAVLLPKYGRSTPGFEIAVHRFGAGTLVTDAETSAGDPYFIGLRNDTGMVPWGEGIVPLLLGEYVQLEVRPGITGCGCGGAPAGQHEPAAAQEADA